MSLIKSVIMVSLIALFSYSTPVLSEVSTIHGYISVGSTKVEVIENSTTDEGPLTEPGIDTDPTSDKGVFDIFNLFLVIFILLFMALVTVISVILFRKFMIKKVEWVEDPNWTYDEELDDEPLPEDGLITKGDL